jgi:hypothetical protein
MSTGQQAISSWRANRRGRMRIREQHALRREAIQMRSAESRSIGVTPRLSPSEVIKQNENDVWLNSIWLGPGCILETRRMARPKYDCKYRQQQAEPGVAANNILRRPTVNCEFIEKGSSRYRRRQTSPLATSIDPAGGAASARRYDCDYCILMTIIPISMDRRWRSRHARFQRADERRLLANPDDPKLPRNWRSCVNKVETQAELNSLRRSL